MKKLLGLMVLTLFVLSLESSFSQRLTITVKNTITVDKPVSQLLYGNFIEMGFGRCENLWAEMLEIAGPYIDIVNNRGGNIKMQTADMAIIREYNQKSNRNITMCHSEFRAPLVRASSGADELNRVERKGKNSIQNMSVRWAFGMSVMDQFLQFQDFGGDYSFLNFTSLNDTWGENLINLAKEGAFLSSCGKALEFLNKLPIAYPLASESKTEDPDIHMHPSWNRDKTVFTLLVLNFSGVEKEYSFDISELKTKFNSEATHLTVYADNDNDFNSPADRNKIKNIDEKATISKNSFSTKLKPYSANAWIFEVKKIK